MLLIRALDGNADELLNCVHARAAEPPKALWEVAHGGHTRAIRVRPTAYERRVVSFFEQALRPSGWNTE